LPTADPAPRLPPNFLGLGANSAPAIDQLALANFWMLGCSSEAFHPAKAHHVVRQEGEQAQTSVPQAPTLQNFNSTLPDQDSCASQRLGIVSVLQVTKNVE
jgi:hypothetical protein